MHTTTAVFNQIDVPEPDDAHDAWRRSNPGTPMQGGV